jgi:protein involved in polysaccharide export with SLBB domain
MKPPQCGVRHWIGMAGVAAIVLAIAGCRSPQTQPPPLRSGDQIEVHLTGTPRPILPSTFVLSGTGRISLPFLGTSITAIGKSPHELEKIIHDAYVPRVFTQISVTVIPGRRVLYAPADGPLTTKRVTVAPDDRYLYVSGAINQTNAGKQLYTGKITVLGAISAAGGFNDFAARTRVQLTRQDGTIFIEDCKKALKNPKLDLEVLPGDKIFVDKQTFRTGFVPGIWLP